MLTPLVPPPTSVPVVGIPSTSQGPGSTSVSEISALLKTEVAKISDDLPPQCIIPTPVDLSSSVSTTSSSVSTNITTLPVVVLPELAIPAEAYPEQINRLGGGKDYLAACVHSGILI